METFTTAPKLGSHLETSRRTTPTATVSQVRAMAIAARSHVFPAPSARGAGTSGRRKIVKKTPAKIMKTDGIQ